MIMLLGLSLFSTAIGLVSSARPTPIEPSRDAAVVRVLSGATIAREELAIVDAGDAAVGTLTLTLTSRSTIAASTMIELPRGSRIVGMTLDHGGEAFVAKPLALVEANRRFTEAVEPPPEITVPRRPSERDPAVLELDHSDEAEFARLTVFPISPGAPATVTITFATARFDRLQVYGGGALLQTVIGRDLDAASSDAVVLAKTPTPLGPGRALYAAPAGPAPTAEGLARHFLAVQPTLARCAAVDDETVVQHVSLRVDVDELGRTWLRGSDGAGKYLVDCLRQVIEHVQFADDAQTSLDIALDVTPAVPPPPPAR